MPDRAFYSGFIDSGSDDWTATEGARASGANGRAPDATRQETDPDWQPL
jgi:hypothetical protein